MVECRSCLGSFSICYPGASTKGYADMQIKMLEIRDDATCIPVIAMKMQPDNGPQNRYLWRCGYPRDGHGVVVMKMQDQKATSDPDEWGDRTMPPAHDYIIDNFDILNDGDVIDTRVILGERAVPVAPDIWKVRDHE